MTATTTSPQSMPRSVPRLPPTEGAPTSRRASDGSKPSVRAPGGTETPGDHIRSDAQVGAVAGADHRSGQPELGTQELGAAAVQPGQDRTANDHATLIGPSLFDPALALAADVLDDLERVTIANQNRLRQLTRSVEDKDGEVRGFGLDESHSDVAKLASIVDVLGKVTADASKNLERLMRRHPLGPWAKTQKGVGDKQIGRLLAAIGDPHWRDEIVKPDGTVVPEGPRTVSALWAYCGYHVLPASGQVTLDAQALHAAGGAPDRGDPDQDRAAAQTALVGVAPSRKRGQKANWSSTAKMRTYLIAESCMKQLKKPCAVDADLGYAVHITECACSPYRVLYDAARAKYADATHGTDCVRCGPKGKPAQAGSPLSDAHKLARALRIVSKEILKDLWREAKRIHDATEEVHR